MKLLAILSACLFLAVESAVVTNPRYLGSRIVGGEATTIEKHPYTVSLRGSAGGSHFCGGILVSNKTVLTAAHCTVGRRPENLFVNAGSTFRTEGGILSSVEKIVVHPNYNGNTIDFDFSVVVLSKALNLSPKIQPVGLPAENKTLTNGTLVNVSGWGNTQSSTESSVQLRNVVVPIVDRPTCKDRYKGYTVTDRMICAGQTNGGKDSCQGDSGGPLVRDNTVYGVVSWGLGCALPNYPGVYANVPSVVRWVKDNLQ